MANIRMSEHIRQRIDWTIRQQFETRRAPLRQAFEQALNSTWTQMPELLKTWVRREFKVTDADLVKTKPFLHTITGYGVRKINDLNLPTARTVSFGYPVPWPVGFSKQPTGEEFDGVVSSLKPHVEAMQALNDEERVFTNQVRNLLTECGSYRQAVERWPQLVGVTPQEILDKHNAPTEKRERREITVKVDADALNVALVKNKLAGAAGMQRP